MGATVIDLDKKRIERQVFKSGYYIKARKIKDSKVNTAPPHIREVWDYLLREANHSDNEKFKCGQCLRSYKEIQDDLSWFIGYRKESYTNDQIKKAMKFFIANEMVTTQRIGKKVLITVCNYKEYQDPNNYKKTIICESPSESPELNDTKAPNCGNVSLCNDSKKDVSKKHESPELNDTKAPMKAPAYNKQELKEYTPPKKTKKKPSRQKPKRIISDKIKNFAGAFMKYISETYPQHTPKGKDVFGNSIKTIDELVRLDGFEEDYIFDVIRWAAKDSFWGKNIKSLASLRDKSKNGLLKFQNISLRYEEVHQESEPEPEMITVFKVDPDECEYKEPEL